MTLLNVNSPDQQKLKYCDEANLKMLLSGFCSLKHCKRE